MSQGMAVLRSESVAVVVVTIGEVPQQWLSAVYLPISLTASWRRGENFCGNVRKRPLMRFAL
jgi:hypothetical protein